MRYFIHLKYLGKNFSGWQVQPNAETVQGAIERGMQVLLGRAIDLVGCGRTDTGVHASQYYAHFDADEIDCEQFRYKLDHLVGPEISIIQVFPVAADAHARFSATRRKYQYYMSGGKPVFSMDTCWYYPRFGSLDWQKIHELTSLLQEYDAFLPFCKTNSDLKHFRCESVRMEWEVDPENSSAVFSIESNRFLRGMVRLIVGTCIYVGQNKLGIEEVRQALDDQVPLKKAYSAPATGLFLNWVSYPFLENSPAHRPTNCF